MPIIENDDLFVDERQLAPGQKYKITLTDCCIEGEIIGTFRTFDNKEDLYVFDIGKIGPGWGAWHTEPI